jgi:hypothetical protein
MANHSTCLLLEQEQEASQTSLDKKEEEAEEGLKDEKKEVNEEEKKVVMADVEEEEKKECMEQVGEMKDEVEEKEKKEEEEWQNFRAEVNEWLNRIECWSFLTVRESDSWTPLSMLRSSLGQSALGLINIFCFICPRMIPNKGPK